MHRLLWNNGHLSLLSPLSYILYVKSAHWEILVHRMWLGKNLNFTSLDGVAVPNIINWLWSEELFWPQGWHWTVSHSNPNPHAILNPISPFFYPERAAQWGQVGQSTHTQLCNSTSVGCIVNTVHCTLGIIGLFRLLVLHFRKNVSTLIPS